MRKWPSLLWERHLLEEQQMLARGVEGPLTVLFWLRGFGPGTWGGAVARAPTGRREPSPPPSLPAFRPTPTIAHRRRKGNPSHDHCQKNKTVLPQQEFVALLVQVENKVAKAIHQGADPINPFVSLFHYKKVKLYSFQQHKFRLRLFLP